MKKDNREAIRQQKRIKLRADLTEMLEGKEPDCVQRTIIENLDREINKHEMESK